MNETRADQKWLEDFTLELRLRNVNGKDTGDAVAHVESYCVDSGESPRAAFGDPAEYAHRLDLETDEWNIHGMLVTALPSIIGLVALLVFLQAIDGVYRGESFTLNIWQAGFIMLLIVVLIIAVLHLSTLVKNKWSMISFAIAGPLAGVGIGVSGTMAAGSPTVALPALPVTIVSAAALLAAALWGHVRNRNHADPLIKPTPGNAENTAEHRAARFMSSLGNWLLVLAAPVFAVIQYFIVP